MGAPFDKFDYAPLNTFAFEQVTASTVAVILTVATWSPTGGTSAARAVITVQDNGVRYRADGTAPTATVGTPLAAGDELTIWGTEDIRDIQFIRSGAADAILNVHYAR
jgi:hypothetical protein